MKKLARLACSTLLISLSAVVAEETEFTIGPDYADAPETKPQDGVPKGKIEAFTMNSKNSTIYKGIAKNAGHTDDKVTRQTLPAALEWLWQGYVAK